MKNTLLNLLLAGMLAALPLAASATMTDAEATTLVQDMLIESRSSEEILGVLIKDGRSLKQATVVAVQAVSGHAKLNLARVGICLARDNDEAEAIGRGCVDVCAPVTDKVIESLVQSYITGGCEQPDQYGSASVPSEGGVSPSL
jgi:hypothetical protein